MHDQNRNYERKEDRKKRTMNLRDDVAYSKKNPCLIIHAIKKERRSSNHTQICTKIA